MSELNRLEIPVNTSPRTVPTTTKSGSEVARIPLPAVLERILGSLSGARLNPQFPPSLDFHTSNVLGAEHTNLGNVDDNAVVNTSGVDANSANMKVAFAIVQLLAAGLILSSKLLEQVSKGEKSLSVCQTDAVALSAKLATFFRTMLGKQKFAEELVITSEINGDITDINNDIRQEEHHSFWSEFTSFFLGALLLVVGGAAGIVTGGVGLGVGAALAAGFLITAAASYSTIESHESIGELKSQVNGLQAQLRDLKDTGTQQDLTELGQFITQLNSAISAFTQKMGTIQEVAGGITLAADVCLAATGLGMVGAATSIPALAGAIVVLSATTVSTIGTAVSDIASWSGANSSSEAMKVGNGMQNDLNPGYWIAQGVIKGIEEHDSLTAGEKQAITEGLEVGFQIILVLVARKITLSEAAPGSLRANLSAALNKYPLPDSVTAALKSSGLEKILSSPMFGKLMLYGALFNGLIQLPQGFMNFTVNLMQDLETSVGAAQSAGAKMYSNKSQEVTAGYNNSVQENQQYEQSAQQIVSALSNALKTTTNQYQGLIAQLLNVRVSAESNNGG